MTAPDIHVTTTTTQPLMEGARTELTGVDESMDGLIKFAQVVEPGSARILASVGDERNALILLTVRGAFGPGGEQVTLPAARLSLFDEHQQVKEECVVFFVVPD